MAFTLPPLPYAYDALEPHIDAQTMEIHHGKHHKAYVNNLNAAIEKAPELADKSLDELMRDINTRARSDPHRGAQQRRRPLEPLACSGSRWRRTRAASRRASSATRSTARSATSRSSRSSSPPPASAASARAGRGWSTTAASSSITSTPNQDNPLMDGKPADPRPRRVGARVLSQVPEPPAGLHEGVVERRELGGVAKRFEKA